ncbi:MAG TPA: AAA family ATPase [Thermodesulfobacteriota bacterium]|nr:AAA family ATPase [Thermodesulfobacteriota bacterium]
METVRRLPGGPGRRREPGAAAPLDLTLLGGFQARLPSGRTLALRPKKAQALLAYLAVRPGQAHPRAKLAALLWGEAGEEQARSSLRQTLFTLRKALPAGGPPPLLFEGETVAVNPAAVRVDVADFEACVGKGTPEALEEAAALYRGDLLDALDVDEAPFEEWLLAERERLRELALEALSRLLAHQTAAAPEQAIQTALRLLALDPLQEPAHRALMRLYAGQGRRGAALRQYQLCVSVLQRELGVEPEAETRQLYQEILQRRRLSPPAAAEAPPAARRARLPRRHGAPFRPAGAGLELPLIGREAEWAGLSGALERAWQGHGQTVAIIGEAGIGKSRLLAELAAEAGRRGGRVLLGRCYELEQILPFRPWVDALGSGLAGLPPAELEDLSPVWRAELARLLPEWAEAGLPAPLASDDPLRLFEAVAQLVASLAARQPLAVVLEDLHWADEMSLRLLGFLSRRASAWPVLIALTAREEELADAPLLRRLLEALDRERCLRLLRLSPLAQPDAERLVRALLDEAALARLGEQIRAASEGNPFMVVETVRALQEGSWPPTPSGLPLPDRVREVIAGRLDRLGERARQLVAVAAVIGREFDFTLLQHAAGLAAPEAAQGVEELVRRRLLHGVGERFDFAHDRIREVAYARLLAPYRRLLHRQVAEALETLHADNLEPHCAELGVHCREGEAWAKALSYLRRAGARAAARGAHREAVACFEQALDVLARLPEQRELLEEAVDLRFDLRCSLNPLGEFGRILECLREAETLARRLADERRLARVSSYLSQYFWIAGDPDRSIEYGRQALDTAAAAGDLATEVVTTYYLGRTYHAVGDYRRAVEYERKSAASVEGRLRAERFGLAALPSVAARVWLVWSLAELGELAEAIAGAEEGLRIAEEAEAPFSLAGACLAAGIAYLRKGDLPRAVSVLERGRALCRAHDFPFWLDWVESCLGYACALSGRPADALPLLGRDASASAERAAAPGERAGDKKVYRPLWLAHLGEACLLAGRPDEALALAQRALELARASRERGHEGWALRLLGEIASRREPPETGEAEAAYRGALALARELAMRPLEAHCRLGLGRLLRRSGRPEEGRAELSAAAGLFRAMAAEGWLAAAEAELAQAG